MQQQISQFVEKGQHADMQAVKHPEKIKFQIGGFFLSNVFHGASVRLQPVTCDNQNYLIAPGVEERTLNYLLWGYGIANIAALLSLFK